MFFGEPILLCDYSQIVMHSVGSGGLKSVARIFSASNFLRTYKARLALPLVYVDVGNTNYLNSQYTAKKSYISSRGRVLGL